MFLYRLKQIILTFNQGFSYGLLDVLNSHFQTVLGITKLQSTGLQVMYFGGGYVLLHQFSHTSSIANNHYPIDTSSSLPLQQKSSSEKDTRSPS